MSTTSSAIKPTDEAKKNSGEIDSDYGSVVLEICDRDLRSKVVSSISKARQEVNDPDACINLEHLAEISAYINRLEDALLRHHWGTLKESEILDYLKNCSGLDIKALAYSLDTMHAEDA